MRRPEVRLRMQTRMERCDDRKYVCECRLGWRDATTGSTSAFASEPSESSTQNLQCHHSWKTSPPSPLRVIFLICNKSVKPLSRYPFYQYTVKFRKKALFEGLIFGGAYTRAYLRREICVSRSIELALQLEVNLLFFLCFTLCLRAIFQVQAPGGLIFGGAI